MIICNACGSKAVIKKSDFFNPEYSRLYCSCKNENCGQRFVVNLEFSHITKQSKIKEREQTESIIQAFPPDKKDELLYLLIQNKSLD